MQTSQRIKIILITPVFILIGHYLSVIPHEYAHSIMAWILGYKANPLDVNYGVSNWNNLLTLSNIDAKVDYQKIFITGHRFHLALVAFSGAGIANFLFFFITLLLLKMKKVKHLPYLYYLLFWCNLMNLGNLYSFMPIHTFAPMGDMAAIETGLNISAWWIYVVLAYPMAFLIWHFYTCTIISTFIIWKIHSTAQRASLIILCSFILFGFFGDIIGTLTGTNYTAYGPVSFFLSVTSFLMIPGIIMLAWPSRRWVNHQLLVMRDKLASRKIYL